MSEKIPTIESAHESLKESHERAGEERYAADLYEARKTLDHSRLVSFQG